jgi:hypothetical protein
MYFSPLATLKTVFFSPPAFLNLYKMYNLQNALLKRNATPVPEPAEGTQG